MVVEVGKGPVRAWEGGAMPNTDEKTSRAGFPKLGVLGTSATALAAGCGGEGDEGSGLPREPLLLQVSEVST